MRTSKKKHGQIVLHLVFIFISIVFIAPLLLVISSSLSSEDALMRGGFTLIPRGFTTQAYQMIFEKPIQIFNSYRTTILYSFAGTMLGVLIMGLMAYPLARPNFVLRKPVNFIVLFTMLFSGGMVPSYLVNTRYLHLDNTIWIYILPALVVAYHVFVLKAGYKGVPEELIDAAKVDGANEFYICFKIVMPLSKATLATIAFLNLVSLWNNWMTSSIYIQNPELYSLQYLLQRILKEAEFMKQLAEEGQLLSISGLTPLESLRYAMAIVMAGPMLVIFPFFQKYFVKGMTLGAVKG